MAVRRAVAVLLCLLGATWAEDTNQDQRISNLEQENAELKERLSKLEAAEEAREQVLKSEVEDLTEQEGLGLNLVVHRGNVHGTFQIFGDVGFLYADPAVSGRGNAYFFNGSVDIFFTARVGDHFHALSETVFQTSVGSTTDSSKWDQERLWGAWSFSDLFQIKFGLGHSPISLWNRLFHHGRWLELTVERPLLAQFEGGSGILPMHEAGLELFGVIPISTGRLSYIVFVSNGRGRLPNQVSEFSDYNNEKAVTFGGGYSPNAAQTIYVGLFARSDVIPANPADPARARPMREWCFSFQFMLQGERFDVLAEFAYIYQDDQTSGSKFDNYVGYVQVGYHLTDQWTPYVRGDLRDMEQGDPFYAPLNRDLDVWDIVVGVRWDFLNNAALKFELAFGDQEERDGGGTVTTGGYIRFGVQLAFVF